MVSVPDWMKEPTGIMKLSCTGLTLLIVVIARLGFPDKSPPSTWSTDHEVQHNLMYCVEGWVKLDTSSCRERDIHATFNKVALTHAKVCE